MPAATDRDLLPEPRGVRTTRSRGRMSAHKRTVLTNIAPRWAVTASTAEWARLGLASGFGADGPLYLDIGVGVGTATRAWAIEHPTARVLAIEVFRPGLAQLVEQLEAEGPENVRVAEGDAVQILAAIEPSTVSAIRVLFPDPWPKRRHHRRRLVDAAFVERAATLLTSDGELHVATDWDDYAAQVRTLLDQAPRFTAVPDDSGGAGNAPWRSARPERPTTTYEARGLAEGRAVTDLVARRVDGAAASPDARATTE